MVKFEKSLLMLCYGGFLRYSGSSVCLVLSLVKIGLFRFGGFIGIRLPAVRSVIKLWMYVYVVLTLLWPMNLLTLNAMSMTPLCMSSMPCHVALAFLKLYRLNL